MLPLITLWLGILLECANTLSFGIMPYSPAANQLLQATLHWDQSIYQCYLQPNVHDEWFDCNCSQAISLKYTNISRKVLFLENHADTLILQAIRVNWEQWHYFCSYSSDILCRYHSSTSTCSSVNVNIPKGSELVVNTGRGIDLSTRYGGEALVTSLSLVNKLFRHMSKTISSVIVLCLR